MRLLILIILNWDSGRRNLYIWAQYRELKPQKQKKTWYEVKKQKPKQKFMILSQLEGQTL